MVIYRVKEASDRPNDGIFVTSAPKLTGVSEFRSLLFSFPWDVRVPQAKSEVISILRVF